MLKNTLIVVSVGFVFICLIVAGAIGYLAWDMGIHFWDDSQVPQITVSTGLRPIISFTPNTAYNLSVYEGSQDGNGFGNIWTAIGGSEFENNLQSPLTYGISPQGSQGQEAPPLEPGKTYTISIFRKDPQGKGDGFTNTRHRYVGLKTFIATDHKGVAALIGVVVDNSDRIAETPHTLRSKGQVEGCALARC